MSLVGTKFPDELVRRNFSKENSNSRFNFYNWLYFVLSTLVIVALQQFTVGFSFSFDQLIEYLLIFSTDVTKLAFSFFFFLSYDIFPFSPGR